jgi:valyl-tRNA synthetase
LDGLSLIPVIADESVNPEFGTGAVKVTPGHDQVSISKPGNL